MSKYLSSSGFKWIDLKEFSLNRYSSSNLKECVLELDLEYSKELHN